jgi:WD40 repeat protein
MHFSFEISISKRKRVWNIENGTCEKTMTGHDHWITCLLALSNGKLASGSADSTVRIWNVEDGSEEKILRGHTFWIRCLCIWNDRFASGSGISIFRIFFSDFFQPTERFEFGGKMEAAK